MPTRAKLVLASATMLFVELALIRWMGANVVHLSYFSNFVLLGSFLGIGLGFLVPNRRGGWLVDWAPVPLALLVVFVRLFPVQIAQTSSEILYFSSVKPTGLPIWVTLPVLFGLTAVTMAGIGRIVADLFGQLPSLDAYRYDLIGSLLGTVAFTGLSFLRAPSMAWGLVAVAALLVLRGRVADVRYALPACIVVAVLTVESLGTGVSWSPYYKITTRAARSAQRVTDITANGVPHQSIVPLNVLLTSHERYMRPYDDTPANPHRRVLVIGAGNGNDVALALAQGATYVDAVEIDPRLLQIGRQIHPAHPYADPRVHAHVDDGRAFLERTHGKYDLVILALPDSLTLVAGASNLRLESYLFTRQAFEAARQHLAPHGAFAMYNYYRERWLVDRFGRTLTEVFGHAPCMTTEGAAGKSAVLVVGMTPADQHCARSWSPVGVAPKPVSDDRPFPYLRAPTVPRLYVWTLLAILLVSGAAVRATGVRLRPTARYTDMFLMGAAFLLLETKNVIGFALYFGTTWVVNAFVFSGVLLAVLLAVELRRRIPRVSQPLLQALLFVTLAVAWAVPTRAVLALPFASRLMAAIALAFAPIFFANLIFSDRLAAAEDPTSAFGANLLGALVGGALEYAALVTGYQALLIVVAVIYALAFVAMRRLGPSPAPAWQETERATTNVASARAARVGYGSTSPS